MNRYQLFLKNIQLLEREKDVIESLCLFSYKSVDPFLKKFQKATGLNAAESNMPKVDPRLKLLLFECTGNLLGEFQTLFGHVDLSLKKVPSLNIQESNAEKLKINIIKNKKLKEDILARILKKIFKFFCKEIIEFNEEEIRLSGRSSNRSMNMLLNDFVLEEDVDNKNEDQFIKSIWERLDGHQALEQFKKDLIQILVENNE